jgi:hypothetical protein
MMSLIYCIFVLSLLLHQSAHGIELSSQVNSSLSLSSALPLLLSVTNSSSSNSSRSITVEYDATQYFPVFVVSQRNCTILAISSSLSPYTGTKYVVASSITGLVKGQLTVEPSDADCGGLRSSCVLNITVNGCPSGYSLHGAKVQYFATGDSQKSIVTASSGYSTLIGANFGSASDTKLIQLSGTDANAVMTAYVYSTSYDSSDYSVTVNPGSSGSIYVSAYSGITIVQIWSPIQDPSVNSTLIVTATDQQAQDYSALYLDMIIRLIILVIALPIGFALFLILLSVCLRKYLPIVRRKWNRNQILKKGVSNSEVKKSEEIEFSTRESANCVICLGDYDKSDQVRVLGCGHHFHKHCVDEWLIEKSKCPVCVQPIKNAVNYREQKNPEEGEEIAQDLEA